MPQGIPGHHGGGHHPHHPHHEGGREGDPYSFVDEYSGPPPRPVEEILGQTQPKRRGRKPKHIKLMENGWVSQISLGGGKFIHRLGCLYF